MRHTSSSHHTRYIAHARHLHYNMLNRVTGARIRRCGRSRMAIPLKRSAERASDGGGCNGEAISSARQCSIVVPICDNSAWRMAAWRRERARRCVYARRSAGGGAGAAVRERGGRSGIISECGAVRSGVGGNAWARRAAIGCVAMRRTARALAQ